MSDGHANKSSPVPERPADAGRQLAESTPIQTCDPETVRRFADGQSPSLSPAAKAFLSRMPVPKPGVALASAEAAPSGVDKSRLRPAADIIAQRGPVPPGFPVGPWATHHEAKLKLNAYFHPGFSVNLHGYKGATKFAGPKSYLLCHMNNEGKAATAPLRVRGGLGVSCKWRIRIEQSVEGWIISNFTCLDHNHELVSNPAEALAHASLRSIPEDLANFGTLLKQGGLAPAEILKYGLVPTCNAVIVAMAHTKTTCLNVYVLADSRRATS